PWEFVDGWIRQFVAAEQPDLIFTYTSGTLDGLDALLADIRRTTTAEVIVPSLHFKPPGEITPDNIENGMGVQWAKVREICAIHSSAAGSRLQVSFTGSQINVIGRKTSGGGTAQIQIDGIPADQAPLFLTTYIKSNKKGLWQIPHAADLGAHPVPQAWTITVT